VRQWHFMLPTVNDYFDANTRTVYLS
jgi:hypothetical protein